MVFLFWALANVFIQRLWWWWRGLKWWQVHFHILLVITWGWSDEVYFRHCWSLWVFINIYNWCRRKIFKHFIFLGFGDTIKCLIIVVVETIKYIHMYSLRRNTKTFSSMFSLNVFRIPGASWSDEMVMRFLMIDMVSNPRALGWSWRVMGNLSFRCSCCFYNYILFDCNL